MKKILHPIAYLVVAFASYKIGGSLTSDTPDVIQAETKETAPTEQTVSNSDLPLSATISESAPAPKKATLKELFDTKDYHARYAGMKEYFKGLTSENVEQYLADIGELPPGPKANGIMRLLFSNWGEKDGAAAFEYAKNLTGRDRLGYLSSAATGWAEEEPTEAWGAIMEISNNGSMYGISSYNVLNAISRDDLQLAVDLSLQIKDERRRSSHFSSLVRDVSFHGNYEELFDIANDLESPTDKSNLVKSIFETWGKYETDAPNELMATITDPSVSSSAMEGLMSGWAAVDGSGAFSYALENRDLPGMEDSLESIAKTWSRSVTAQEMESMMDQVSSAENTSKLMQSMIYSVAQANPRLALDWASNTADESVKSRAISSTMSIWVRSNVEEAETYYHSMTDEKTRFASTYTIANGLLKNGASSDRIVALIEGFNDPNTKRNALSFVVQAVSRSKKKPPELQSTLKTMIESDPDMPKEQKDEILKRL